MEYQDKLIETIENNDLHGFEQALEDGLDPDIKLDETPLIFYVLDKMPLLKSLLEHNVNINCSIPNKSYTPLIMAIRRNNTEAAMILLNKGADPDLISFAGLSAIFYAIEIANEEIIEFILKDKKDLKYLNEILDLSIRRNLPKAGIEKLRKMLTEIEKD